jgi:hypothetical protein
MQSANVYITIGLDKRGNVQEVRVNGEAARQYDGKPGLLREGGSTPGCEQVIKTLVHELLTCKKKGDKPPTDPGGGGSDPCCYRDPGTGRVWCWC